MNSVTRHAELWEELGVFVTANGSKCDEAYRILHKWREEGEFHLRLGTFRRHPDGTVEHSVRPAFVRVPFPDLDSYDANEIRCRLEEELPGCTTNKGHVCTHLDSLLDAAQSSAVDFDESNGYVDNVIKKLQAFWTLKHEGDTVASELLDDAPRKKKKKRASPQVSTAEVLASARTRRRSTVYRVGGLVNIDRETESTTLRFLEALSRTPWGVQLTHSVSCRAGGTGELVFADRGRPDLVSYRLHARAVIIAEAKCTHVRDGYKVLQYAQSAKRELAGWDETRCARLILMDKAPPPAHVEDARAMGIGVFWPGVDVNELLSGLQIKG